MGRYSYSGRLVADSVKSVSIYWLKQKKYLVGGCISGTMTWSRNGEKTGSIGIAVNIDNESSWANLNYQMTRRDSGMVDKFDYKVPIVSTKCFFGGKRYWFECSAVKNGVACNRKVAKLYQGQDYFACRHCYNLTYQSRLENPTFRNFPYSVLNLSMKADEMEGKIKKRFYRGRPTRRYARFLKLKSVVGDLNEVRLEKYLYEHK